MDILETILTKIENKTVTIEDFNSLIVESMPESIRKRIQRRIRPSSTRHVDNKTGHNRLDPLGKIADKVQPKRKPSHQMSHGQSRAAHRRSAETQRQNHASE
jgi:hypothetical protein